jgi:hypothetical protein
VLFNPSKGLNMADPTTPAGTPAAGRPFPALRHRLAAAIDGRVICDECGTAYDPGADRCPTCVQRRRPGDGLEAVIDTYGADRPWTTVERSDDLDGTHSPGAEGDETEGGWPW